MADAGGESGFAATTVALRDGRRVVLRAVSADDKDKVQTFMRRLSAESRYSRFMSALRELTPSMLERATHPAPDRELQLLAVSGAGVDEIIVGGARYAAGAGSKDCEFAVTVAEEWQGVGLARRLLETLMQCARARGYARMDGYILASNSGMRGLAKRLGFTEVESPDGPSVRLVRCDLARMA